MFSKTALGLAAIGSALDRDAAQRQGEGGRVRAPESERCETRYDERYESRVESYLVSYRCHGALIKRRCPVILASSYACVWL